MVLFDGFLAYIRLTNPWGAGTCSVCNHDDHAGERCSEKGCRCTGPAHTAAASGGAGSTPREQLRTHVGATDSGAAAVLRGLPGGAIGTKSIDEMPAHIREMLGRS